MTVSVSAFEAILHRKSRAPFANPAKDAAPANLSARPRQKNPAVTIDGSGTIGHADA